MANIKSVEKRARQSVVRRARNFSVMSALRSAQRSARQALQDGNAETAKTAVHALDAALDKAAKRGVIHKNAANRKKSNFHKALSSLS